MIDSPAPAPGVRLRTTVQGLPLELWVGAAELRKPPDRLATKILMLCRASARSQAARRRVTESCGYAFGGYEELTLMQAEWRAATAWPTRTAPSLGVTMSGALADSVLDAIGVQRDLLRRLNETYGAVAQHAESPDGSVRVEVGPTGALRGLWLSHSSYEHGADGLARTILDVSGAAAKLALERRNELLEELTGRFSTAEPSPAVDDAPAPPYQAYLRVVPRSGWPEDAEPPQPGEDSSRHPWQGGPW